MATLKDGVLLKLLQDMKMEDDALEDDPKHVLLQIRSIIPVLEEGGLWPNRGFLLKVSDSSHALYVSLSEEQNEMILGNKLKLGQFVHVEKLEKSHPVPLLKGVTLIPGIHPCQGTPEDIDSPIDLVKFLESSSNVDSVVEKSVIVEKKTSKSPGKMMRGGSSDSESSSKKSEGLKGGRIRSLSASKARPGTMNKCREDFEKTSYDSDADNVISASSARISKRRSWNESELFGVKEIFDSSVVKHELKSAPRSLTSNVSPVRSVRYDSSDENSSSMSRRKSAGSAKRLIKGSNHSQASAMKDDRVQMLDSSCGSANDTKGAETRISWNSLPSNCVKYGKEVVRQRDIALKAAADALQEASASERLLNSLSTLSQFPLAEGDDLQPLVDKFFNLQRDLARTRLIMQSLTSISPFRAHEAESCSTSSVKEALSIALERKKNANTWIKSAVALDLSPCFAPNGGPLTNSPDSTNTLKKATPSSYSNKPKGACIVKKNRSNADVPLLSAFDKEDHPDWTKGSTLYAAADLATSLQDECKRLFLSYVEKYLDEVVRKSSLMEYDAEMAGMMYKVKMVSDWLDVIGKKDGHCDNLDESEGEAYGRVRNKIYGILLKHVERTAMAFDV